MKKTMAAVFLFFFSLMVVNGERRDGWADFRFLTGTWKAEKPGAVITQTYAFIFNGAFLKMTTRGVFRATEAKPRGDIHEDLGIFSYDGFADRLMLRCFHTEGYVITYALESVSQDRKTFTFAARAIENAPPETRAMLIFHKISDTEFTQKFWVAWPKKDYTCFSDHHFKKAR